MAVPVAAVRNVTKRFPGVVANDDVSLDFNAGEIHVLLGENGAGKSTLIGILAGMQQPDEGEILIGGKPVKIASPRASRRLRHRHRVPACAAGAVSFGHREPDAGRAVVADARCAAPALARFRELSAAARRHHRSRCAGRAPVAGRAAAGRDHARALARREGADPRRADLDADAAGRQGSGRGDAAPARQGRRPHPHHPQAASRPTSSATASRCCGSAAWSARCRRSRSA